MAYLQKQGADDKLFNLDDTGQTRFEHMQVLTFVGPTALLRCAEFIRRYSNKDGTTGLPPAHIGATSPYIDGANLCHLFYHDNAMEDFDQEGVGNANRDARRAANALLVQELTGANKGHRSF